VKEREDSREGMIRKEKTKEENGVRRDERREGKR
jgi:hypothetical protein